jgi:hypothetical protein
MMKLIDQRAVRPDKAIAVSLVRRNPNHNAHPSTKLSCPHSFVLRAACEQVSEGMLDFTYNWICSVRRFNFFNYVILASDHNTYASLQEAGVRSPPSLLIIY